MSLGQQGARSQAFESFADQVSCPLWAACCRELTYMLRAVVEYICMYLLLYIKVREKNTGIVGDLQRRTTG